MAARAYWQGQIRLALVSIPVEIYSATRTGAGVTFRQIHEPSGKPIKYEKVVPGIGAVEPDEILKGFEYEKGHFVLLDELYLAPAARGRGWGRQALALARDWAIVEGASVMRLEVNHHNARAKALYLSAGYRDDERDILTLPLAVSPTGLHP